MPPGASDLTREAFFAYPHVSTEVGEGLSDPLPLEAPEMAQTHLIFTGASLAALPVLLGGSDALAVLPARAARYYAQHYTLQTFEAPVPFAEFDYYLAWHERSQADIGAQWLISSLTASFAVVESAPSESPMPVSPEQAVPYSGAALRR